MANIDHAALSLIPQPISCKPGEGGFHLTSETVIVADVHTHSLGLLLSQTLAPALGFALPVTNASPDNGPLVRLSIDPALVGVADEGYTLSASTEQVTIQGRTPSGVFYGIQTLRQLLPPAIFSPVPVSIAWLIPAVTIADAPRFAWRGCMLDTARHFIPVSEIMRFIDLLALHKLDVLHLHLVDDQGWRVEIKRYPKLTEIGAWRAETVVGHSRDPQGYDGTLHGGFYTQAELQDIVAYAAQRSITIVPEIEIPGHAQAAIASYPALGVTGESIAVGTSWGIFPYLYNPSEQTLQFLKNVMDEIMAIFPSHYIHIGGDEAIKDQWRASTQVQTRIKDLGLTDEDALQSWFIAEIGTYLAQHGRGIIGWDEILEGGIPPNATVMSWRGTTGGIAAARADHDVIMAPNTYVYFDYYQSTATTEPLAANAFTPLAKVYGYDPTPSELTDQQAHHILGVECALWSEYIPTTAQLEYMAFPRVTALAEVAWSPQAHRDYPHFLQRLVVFEDRLREMGVNFRQQHDDNPYIPLQ
jgi:hexosaminidase